MVLTDRHFAGLLAVRTDLAEFHSGGERLAQQLGLSHVQHHVLLSVRGHPLQVGPRVGDVAQALHIASPSAVELIARLVRAGLMQRQPDPQDRRATRLALSELGDQAVHQLSQDHLPRLRELTSRAAALLDD